MPLQDVIGIVKIKDIRQTYCVFPFTLSRSDFSFPCAHCHCLRPPSPPAPLHLRTFKNECHCTPNTNGQLSNASRSVEKASPLFPTPKGTVFVRHFCPPLEPTSSNRTHSCRSFFSQQLRPKRTSPVVLLATATVDHYCLTTPNAITRRASRRSPRSSHRTFIIADHMNVIAVS